MTTRRALIYSFLDRYAGLGIHTASAMVIARLLNPADIGVYSLTMVLVGFVATFRDLGAGQYLVQRPAPTETDLLAVWTVQVGLGLVFALLIGLTALPVAIFYREHRIREIMFVMAANFAVTPFVAYPSAWLTRNMQFGALAGIRFSGAVAHAISAIWLVWAGFGAISLAWANLITTIVSLFAIQLANAPRIPGRPRLRALRDVVSFGGKITGHSLLVVIRGSAPELFLGRIQGMAETGLFSRAQGLVAMFERLVMDSVNAVALPYFSKQLRDGKAPSSAFLHAMSLITGLGWAFLASLATLAYPAIRVLYGSQWDLAVDPARWLAGAAAIGVPGSAAIAPLIATGAIGGLLRTGLALTIVGVAFSGIGAFFGLETMSQLTIPSALIASASWLSLAKTELGFAWRDLTGVLARSALVAAGAALVPLITSIHFGWRPENILPTIAISVPGGIFGFLLVARGAHHPLWGELTRFTSRAR